MELPSEFITRMREMLGDEQYSLFENAMMQSPVVAVRGNKRKVACVDNNSIFGMDASETGPTSRVPWCEDGYYLQSRPTFTLQPLLHAGAFYVQDASSMIYQLITKQLIDSGYIDANARVLDACAAPGGKTTAIINSLGDDAVIVANEYDSRRAAALKENLCKWGFPNTIITQGDTAFFADMHETFNLIAVDAPCSGEGMMRKEDVAVSQWSENLISHCCRLQEEILLNILPTLQPGGILIYSTCTFNRRENEERVAWLVEQIGLQPIDISVPKSSGIMSQINSEYPALRFMPHHTQGEGQFVAVLRKPTDSEAQESTHSYSVRKTDFTKKNGKKDNTQISLLKEAKDWLSPIASTKGKLVVTADTIRYYSDVVEDMLEKLPKKVRVISAGVETASIKGKNLIPATGLALSGIYNAKHFPAVNVSKQEALAYLRHESLLLPQNIAKGFALIMYDNHPLGWVKNIGNRANNLYPQGWKIRIKS